MTNNTNELSLLPITYLKSLGSLNLGRITYIMVTFIEDFGHIKKGSQFESILFDLEESTLELCVGDGRNDDYKLYKLKLTIVS